MRESVGFSLRNKGDTRSVSDGNSELRIDYGPGYRVYYFQAKHEIIVLLCGGDKSTQIKDMDKAKRILRCLETLK